MNRNEQTKRAFGHRGRLWQSGMVTVLALSAAGTVRAQEATRAPDRLSDTGGVLQEIVVTAQRRTENLQTTPIAVTVLDADALERKAVVNMYDLQNATPGLTLNSTGVVSLVNIRGIGLISNSPQVVPGVTLYRDGLWQPPIANTAQFFDLGAVEVLRGPQGTFIGTNSTGGAIFFNSKSPDFDGLHGRAQAHVGNYGEVGASGAANLPVNDTLAARIAMNITRRDSFYSSPGLTRPPENREFSSPGELNEEAVRFGLNWSPSDALQVLLKVEAAQKSTGGYAVKPIPNTRYAPFASTDPRTLDYDQFTKSDEETVRGSLEIKWQPTPGGVTYRSLTGYQHFHVSEIYDSDATSSRLPGPPASSQYFDVEERPFSQEINIISPEMERFKWIVGGYYLHDTRDVSNEFPSQAFPNDVLINLYTTLENTAAFGQVSYKILPQLELEIGGRYTRASVDNPPDNRINIGPGIVFINAGGHVSEAESTGKVALNWTANDDNFFYVFAAKGYKAGGFDFGGFEFEPEVVWDYEAGWKSYFFDHRVRTQIGGFWNDYENLQVASINLAAGTNSLRNIGESTIKGIEAQIEAQFGGLRIDASGAYVKSSLGAIALVNNRLLPPPGAGNLGPQCAAGAVPPGCFDYTPFLVSVDGKPNPYSPKHTFNAGVEYAFNLSSGAIVTPRVNYSYVGEQWSTLIQAPLTDRLPSFGLWNASLAYDKGDWRVQAYGTNLADKIYVAGHAVNNMFFGAPRQYGVRVSMDF